MKWYLYNSLDLFVSLSLFILFTHFFFLFVNSIINYWWKYFDFNIFEDCEKFNSFNFCIYMCTCVYLFSIEFLHWFVIFVMIEHRPVQFLQVELNLMWNFIENWSWYSCIFENELIFFSFQNNEIYILHIVDKIVIWNKHETKREREGGEEGKVDWMWTWFKSEFHLLLILRNQFEIVTIWILFHGSYICLWEKSNEIFIFHFCQCGKNSWKFGEYVRDDSFIFKLWFRIWLWWSKWSVSLIHTRAWISCWTHKWMHSLIRSQFLRLLFTLTKM